MEIGNYDNYKNEVVPQPFLWAGILLLIVTLLATIYSAFTSIPT